ncbi:uncharacterized protein CC84DRAFT_1161501 [Paraphaeosphaeria sporulosa]|uniref:Uncharacterized protein n=1 Tax=Paraphaeosphaeria sporulosa TaxID=1460663 RepID=A0A177CUK6_9PLEO|nr:uncharacterized protein CC84DRAFT_1161501 [Paraphaeosphaeria sporulosa]OAG10592.1 hypothetical protein CC84DRAFT_1161501 [Paraphaeosphaeria sporulosa]
MPPHKKVYSAPQADDKTFATQQEFLDSLVPVPVESVDGNSRKCAHCWRPYGESNPGEDDAEAPVRFRCNHVFGEQCMRSLFAVRDPVRVDLKPLSFAPGSKGADLGSRLSAYVESHGVEKSALLSGGNRATDFARLIREVMPTVQTLTCPTVLGPGFDLLGKEWMVLVFQMFSQSDSLLDKIELMENAIIVNSDSAKHQMYTFPPGNIMIAPPISVSSPYSTVMPSEPGEALSQATPQMNHISPPHLTWAQEEQKTKKKQETASTTSTTWKDALFSKSKLEIPVQKHKELQEQEELLQEKSESATADEEAVHSYGSPVIPPTMTQIAPYLFADPLAAARDQHTELQEHTKVFVKHLSQSFAKVYEAYERNQYEQGVAAGFQPPVKKLKLAGLNKTSSASPETEFDDIYYHRVRHSVFVLTAIAHRYSLSERGLEVNQPYSYEFHATEETDEENIEDDGFVDAERAPAVVAQKTVLVKRKICRNCCAEPTPYVQSLATPEYVFWPDNKKIPDNCPKCRRILFNKKDD